MMIRQALLMTCLFGFGAPAIGSTESTLTLIPILAMTYEGRDLKIGYELPCGAETWGIFSTATHREGALRLAVLAEVPRVACTGLDRRKVELLPFISTTGYKDVGPLQVGDMTRVRILPPTDLRVSTHASGRSVLVAGYEQECGNVAGSAIRVGSDGTTTVAVASVPVSGGGDCPVTEQELEVAGLEFSKDRRISALAREEDSFERDMYLRLARVESVKTDAGVAVTYRRRCNEAPIGLVATGPVLPSERATASIRAPKVAVGVLVARYVNLICPEGTPRFVSDKLVSSELDLRGADHVATLPPTTSSSLLSLRQPKQYAVMNKVRGEGLVLDLGPTCATQVGAVYTSDAAGNLAVAVLETREGASPCTAPVDSRSIVQPFARKPSGERSIFPMRIRGA